jgi:hypothetical protein
MAVFAASAICLVLLQIFVKLILFGFAFFDVSFQLWSSSLRI